MLAAAGSHLWAPPHRPAGTLPPVFSGPGKKLTSGPEHFKPSFPLPCTFMGYNLFMLQQINFLLCPSSPAPCSQGFRDPIALFLESMEKNSQGLLPLRPGALQPSLWGLCLKFRSATTLTQLLQVVPFQPKELLSISSKVPLAHQS